MARKKAEVVAPVGKKIRKERLKKKMSLDRVANETGFSIDYLKAVESGKQRKRRVADQSGGILQLVWPFEQLCRGQFAALYLLVVLLDFANVMTCQKRAAFAGNDQAADMAILIKFMQQVIHQAPAFDRHRVQAVRPVEQHPSDMAIFSNDNAFAHGSLPGW